MPEEKVYKTVDSPVGRLVLVASEEALYALLWEHSLRPRPMLAGLKRVEDHPIILETERQLAEYFQGTRRLFDLPIEMEGTSFQKKAWEILRQIPYGEVISYGEQAARLGDRRKARAVGGANARNPISIIVPCHRVIGQNGKLTGFGGGLEIKEYLLDLEKQTGLK